MDADLNDVPIRTTEERGEISCRRGEETIPSVSETGATLIARSAEADAFIYLTFAKPNAGNSSDEMFPNILRVSVPIGTESLVYD
jgi:hypothetical protein